MSLAGSSENPALVAWRNGRLTLSFSGGGFLLPYFVGIVKALHDLKIISPGTTTMAGSSSGSLIASAYNSGLSIGDMQKAISDLSSECRLNGTRHRLKEVLKKSLDNLIPDNAHLSCSECTLICITKLFPSPKLLTISRFDSRDDLISALEASCFIPKYSDKGVSTDFRGRSCCDGGLLAFIPCPKIPTNFLVKVCCFPSKQLSQMPAAKAKTVFSNISISPDIFEPFPYNINQMFFLALHPAGDQFLDGLQRKGEKDAVAWAFSTGIAHYLTAPKTGLASSILASVDKIDLNENSTIHARKLTAETHALDRSASEPALESSIVELASPEVADMAHCHSSIPLAENPVSSSVLGSQVEAAAAFEYGSTGPVSSMYSTETYPLSIKTRGNRIEPLNHIHYATVTQRMEEQSEPSTKLGPEDLCKVQATVLTVPSVACSHEHDGVLMSAAGSTFVASVTTSHNTLAGKDVISNQQDVPSAQGVAEPPMDIAARSHAIILQEEIATTPKQATLPDHVAASSTKAMGSLGRISASVAVSAATNAVVPAASEQPQHQSWLGCLGRKMMSCSCASADQPHVAQSISPPKQSTSSSLGSPSAPVTGYAGNIVPPLNVATPASVPISKSNEQVDHVLVGSNPRLFHHHEDTHMAFRKGMETKKLGAMIVMRTFIFGPQE